MVIVKFVVAPGAHQSKVVDVGRPLCWSVKRHDVVRFAACRWGGAQHTTTITGNERGELAGGNGALRSADPQRLTGLAEENRDDISVAPQPFGHLCG